MDRSCIRFQLAGAGRRNSPVVCRDCWWLSAVSAQDLGTGDDGGDRREGEESNLPVMVPLLPLRSWRRVGQVPLAWTRSLPRPPQLHHLFQAVEALHHCNPLFKKKAGSADPSCGSPGVAGVGAVGEAGCCEGYRTCRGLSRRCRCLSTQSRNVPFSPKQKCPLFAVRAFPLFREENFVAEAVGLWARGARVWAAGGQRAAERPVDDHSAERVVHGLSTRSEGRAPVRRTRPQIHGGGPARSFIRLQPPRSRRRA